MVGVVGGTLQVVHDVPEVSVILISLNHVTCGLVFSPMYAVVSCKSIVFCLPSGHVYM